MVESQGTDGAGTSTSLSRDLAALQHIAQRFTKRVEHPTTGLALDRAFGARRMALAIPFLQRTVRETGSESVKQKQKARPTSPLSSRSMRKLSPEFEQRRAERRLASRCTRFDRPRDLEAGPDASNPIELPVTQRQLPVAYKAIPSPSSAKERKISYPRRAENKAALTNNTEPNPPIPPTSRDPHFDTAPTLLAQRRAGPSPSARTWYTRAASSSGE